MSQTQNNPMFASTSISCARGASCSIRSHEHYHEMFRILGIQDGDMHLFDVSGMNYKYVADNLNLLNNTVNNTLDKSPEKSLENLADNKTRLRRVIALVAKLTSNCVEYSSHVPQRRKLILLVINIYIANNDLVYKTLMEALPFEFGQAVQNLRFQANMKVCDPIRHLLRKPNIPLTRNNSE